MSILRKIEASQRNILSHGHRSTGYIQHAPRSPQSRYVVDVAIASGDANGAFCLHRQLPQRAADRCRFCIGFNVPNRLLFSDRQHTIRHMNIGQFAVDVRHQLCIRGCRIEFQRAFGNLNAVHPVSRHNVLVGTVYVPLRVLNRRLLQLVRLNVYVAFQETLIGSEILVRQINETQFSISEINQSVTFTACAIQSENQLVAQRV